MHGINHESEKQVRLDKDASEMAIKGSFGKHFDEVEDDFDHFQIF